MIWNELQKIKSFGSSRESDVTTEDIEKKERELGVQIPTALKEFYLTFHREDPIFSASDSRLEAYRWDRRNGTSAAQNADRPPIKKRPLHSLQPILDLVCGFLGAEPRGVLRQETAKTEQRLGVSLPAPLLECYCQAPSQLRTNPDSFLALNRLEVDEDKKIKFLVGAQGIPKYAFEASSPIVCRYDEQKQSWQEYALIDGFLASELFWNAMNQRKLGVVLAELPACTKRAFGAKGKLGRFLPSVGKELTKGCTRSLYASPDCKILAFYDDEIKNAYLASAGEGPLKQLEKDAKAALSWL